MKINFEIPEIIARHFMHLIARPLNKGQGAIRLIVLGELLVKVPMGCVLDEHQQVLTKILTLPPQELSSTGSSVEQFGVGVPDGAGQLITQLDALPLEQNIEGDDVR